MVETSIKRLDVCAMTVWLALAGIATADAGEGPIVLTVFAAAGTARPVQLLATQFEQSRGIKVQLDLANSGTLARRIEAGADADVYISANAQWMDRLIEKGLVLPDSRVDLLQTDLVLVVPRGRETSVRLDSAFDLPGSFDGPLAMGDPSHVPAGTYAAEALEHFGWLIALRDRMTNSPSVTAALTLVERGEALLGIVYACNAGASEKVDIVGTFQPGQHTPIQFSAGICRDDKDAAREFLDFLLSQAAAETFARCGFRPVHHAPGHASPTTIEPVETLSTGQVWSAVVLSLKVACVCTLLLVAPGVALGWLLARREFVGKRLLSAVVHVPLVIPPVATGYLLLMAFGVNAPLGRWLQGILGVRLAFHWFGAALASAVVALPLMVRSVRLAMAAVDPRLEAAARTLGSCRLHTFATVTLPLAWPGILAGCVIAFARSMGEFGATITFAGNLAGRTRTLPLAAFSYMQTPGGEAVAMKLVAVSVAISIASVLAAEVLGHRLGPAETGRVV